MTREEFERRRQDPNGPTMVCAGVDEEEVFALIDERDSLLAHVEKLEKHEAERRRLIALHGSPLFTLSMDGVARPTTEGELEKGSWLRLNGALARALRETLVACSACVSPTSVEGRAVADAIEALRLEADK